MTALDPKTHAWMIAPETRAVMAALTADGGAARFVGGAVRNALLGAPVTDVDIATPLTPDDVTARLQNAGLGAVPTGLAHGTVTAVAGGKPFEITTLRRDVSTDGRRATVAFTTDWKEDAARRDFTMNALYADAAGQVFDYFGGLDDLRARRVRFVGDPATRIREDYLRILRLFRFHAWYGKGELDADALAAAIAQRNGLKTLSGERVQKEMLRLLEADDPLPALSVMAKGGILAEILSGEAQLARLRNLIAIGGTDAVLRLAALLPGNADAAQIASALKLSNADRERMIDAEAKDARIDAGLSPEGARRLLYRLGSGCFRDSVLLNWASSNAAPNDARWRALLTASEQWTKPEFPLTGKDAMAAGIEEGPKIGVLLRDLEAYWVDADFKPGRTALLAKLNDAINKPRA
jgi:poly(A) polymerase